ATSWVVSGTSSIHWASQTGRLSAQNQTFFGNSTSLWLQRVCKMNSCLRSIVGTGCARGSPFGVVRALLVQELRRKLLLRPRLLLRGVIPLDLLVRKSGRVSITIFGRNCLQRLRFRS